MNNEVKNPFPGLRPFEFGDNHLFFGRDEQTTELTTRLRKNRFVAVVGTSGSGKSSLVRAGLLPELLSGTMAGAGSSWETAIMRPGGDPLSNLANSIIEADLYDPEEEDIASQVRATLTRSGLGLVEAMRQSDLSEGTNFLLVVDQFEEIFRFRRSEDATDEQAAFFVNLLLEASAQTNLPLYVIITMRSDFLGECSQFPRLADTVNEGEFLIPRLNRDQRKEAILGPVKVAGGSITDRLLLRLLNDIGDDPDQLPILQHALMRTWDLFEEQKGEGELDLKHYDATGGMTEALSRHADEVYNEQPDEEHKRIAQKLFKSLTEKVDANRGIRRPMALRELHEICGGEESHLREVVDSFRRTGCTFLMPAGEREITLKSIIDISHESLMRVWRGLRNWVDEEAQSAKIYRRLADTATLYKEGKAGLYRDPDLQIALSWREENRPNKTWADRYYPGFEGAMAFLDQSHEESVREEREREEARKKEVEQAQALAKARARTARIFKFASFGIAVLAIVAVMAMINARKSRDIAEKEILKQAQRSEDTANRYIETGDFTYATPWLVDSIKLSENSLSSKIDRTSKLSKLLMQSIKISNHYNINEDVIEQKIINNNKIAILSKSKFYILDEKLTLIKDIELQKYFSTPICFDQNAQHLFGIIDEGKVGLLNVDELSIKEFNLANEIYDQSIKAKFSPSQRYITFLSTSESETINIIDIKDSVVNKFKLNSALYRFNYSDNVEELIYITVDWESQKYKFKFISLVNKPTIKNNKDLILNLNEGKITNIKYINGMPHLSINGVDGSGKIIRINSDIRPFGFAEATVINNFETKLSLNTPIIFFDYVDFNRTFITLNSDQNITISNQTDENNNGQALSQSQNIINIKSDVPIEKFYIVKDLSNIITINNKNNLEIWDINTGEKKFNRLINNNSVAGVLANSNGKDLYIIQKDGLIKNTIYPTFINEMDKYFSGYFESINVNIKNNTSYRYYKIIFPQTLRTLDNPENKFFESMRGIQFSEVEFHNIDGTDITNPSTSVKSTHGEKLVMGEVGSPVGEDVTKIIDNNYSTKHFNFSNDEDYGLIFDFTEKQIINSFTLTSANDAPSRNPTKYIIYGSNDGEIYTTISSGDIVDQNYINEINAYNDLINNNINLVSYLSGSILSNRGSIIPDDYNADINADQNLAKIRGLDSDMYFNIKNLNRSIINENQYGTLLHYDILSKNNKTETQHLTQGARAYATSNDYEKAFINYEKAISVNPDDIMSKIHFAAVCLKLEKNELFKSLIEDIIISKAVIKDQQLANRLIGFVVNSPIDINKELLNNFVLDLAQFYRINNIVNENGSVQLDLFKEQVSNIESNNIANTISRNYIEINKKKLNVSDFQAGFTIEYWVKKSDEDDDFGWLFSYGAEGFGGSMRNGFSILQMNRNTIRFELVNSIKGEKTMLDTPMPETGDWFHMANVWNAFNGEALTYMNGKLIGAEKFNGPLIFPESNYNVNLGRSYRGWNMSYWAGGLTELRIWKYPRTQREINKYKDTTIKKNTKGLYEYLKLNQSNGSEIISSLSGQNVGQFFGFNWDTTKDLPILDEKTAYYASFGSISNNSNNNDQQNTLNWERMSDFGKLQALLGNHEDAIRILDMVRFRSSKPVSIENSNYYNGNNPWDILSVCYAYILKEDYEIARKLFSSLDFSNSPSQLNFNWNGIIFGALKKRVESELKEHSNNGM